MVGNKYGPVPLPTHVDEVEFQQIRDKAFEAGKGMDIIVIGLINLLLPGHKYLFMSVCELDI